MTPQPHAGPDSEQELLRLIGSLLEGTLEGTERSRLETRLAGDTQARALYRSYINLHVTLRAHGGMTGRLPDLIPFPEAVSLPAGGTWAGDNTDTQPTPAPTPRRAATWRSRVWVGALAAGVVVALGTVVFVRTDLPRGGKTGAEGPVLAHVTRTADAVWGGPGQPLTLHAPLKGGLLELAAGFAELAFQNGARLVLEAPVRLELLGPDRARLHQGRVVAAVPPPARGFSIETPRLRVIDLGTEFGVGVGGSGETEVQVFRGLVVTEWKGREGRLLEQQLRAGKAVRLDRGAAPQGIPFQPERFVRMFPTDQDGGQPAGPVYNRSRFDTVHVVPAPTRIVLDGDLSDWDRSGAFYSACLPPYHESHYVEGAMMYDPQYLYLGAHVGDPTPMRSRMDPVSDPEHYSWRGGGVIVRLATDPALGWPLQGLGPPEADSAHPEIGHRPQDVDEHLVHVTMWYHQPTAQARLELSYGMDFHGVRGNPTGWAGTFRPDPNGLGYTLEYAIPWSLLKASNRPPQPGDVVGANWTVHWSDEEGHLSRGHLVEITRLDDQPFRFLRARTWGRAVYHGTGHLPPDTVAPRLQPFQTATGEFSP